MIQASGVMWLINKKGHVQQCSFTNLVGLTDYSNYSNPYVYPISNVNTVITQNSNLNKLGSLRVMYIML
jgi:hypothetical protein